MEYAIMKDGRYESIEFNSDAVQTYGMGAISLLARVDGEDFAFHCNIRTTSNAVTKLSFPNSVTLKLVSDKPFEYAVPGVEPTYSDKSEVEPYLYTIDYGNIDYEYASNYFESDAPVSFGGCSAVRKGNLFGRNFDWVYNNQVQFVVSTPRSRRRHAVIGVAGIVPGIEQSNVGEDEILVDGFRMFKLVPFHLLDGINDAGLFCTHNIVPLDYKDDPTKEVRALKEERHRVCVPMLPRFILDHFSSVDDAFRYIRDYTTVYFSNTMLSSGYQSHFMVGDGKRTVIMEFIEGRLCAVKSDYITNFNITGVRFNDDGTVKYPPTYSGIDKFGFGLERWNMIAKGVGGVKGHDGLRGLLDAIKFSNMYGEPFWYSELVRGIDDDGNEITVDTDPSICVNAREKMRRDYAERSRDTGKVWITTHSSVYDIKAKTLSVANQEGLAEYVFVLKG